jgi:2-oxo-4-hydroxy-4-carboxy--5-ureidoimidazoline (OHCU) decarboxylase
LAAQAFTVEGAQDEDVERIFEDSLWIIKTAKESNQFDMIREFFMRMVVMLCWSVNVSWWRMYHC